MPISLVLFDIEIDDNTNLMMVYKLYQFSLGYYNMNIT